MLAQGFLQSGDLSGVARHFFFSSTQQVSQGYDLCPERRLSVSMRTFCRIKTLLPPFAFLP
ncbi:hypothetical protein RHOFW104R3_20325 [Rhodanobacter denitrificans]|nr:hypothetical protein RHOFW104R3_20325 [Rhodanobacter denitrificans]